MQQQPDEVPNFSDVNQVFVWAIIVAFVLTCMGTLAWACLGAPAPLPRPAPAPRAIIAAEVVGTWSYCWGKRGLLNLNPDGTAIENWDGEIYYGTWKVANGRLHVTTRKPGGIVWDWGAIRLRRKGGRLVGGFHDLAKH